MAYLDLHRNQAHTAILELTDMLNSYSEAWDVLSNPTCSWSECWTIKARSPWVKRTMQALVCATVIAFLLLIIGVLPESNDWAIFSMVPLAAALATVPLCTFVAWMVCIMRWDQAPLRKATAGGCDGVTQAASCSAAWLTMLLPASKIHWSCK